VSYNRGGRRGLQKRKSICIPGFYIATNLRPECRGTIPLRNPVESKASANSQQEMY